MGKHYRKGKNKIGVIGKMAVVALAVFAAACLAFYSSGYFDVSGAADYAEDAETHKVRAVVVASSDILSADIEAEGVSASVKEQADSSVKPLKPKIRKNPGELPMLAIIVDDGGYQMNLTKKAAEFKMPLTWAIMPYLPHSKDAAALAASKSIPYLLHLPMQAIPDKDNETSKFLIGRGMSPATVAANFSKALKAVPGAVGINNHRGSTATESETLMKPLMEAVKKQGIIFVDSRTTQKSVAYKEALAAGVPALQNGGFLDNTADKNAIAARFAEVLKVAEKRGALVVICHFRPATFLFLEELNKKYENLPVRLVTVPEMVDSLYGLSARNTE